MELSGEFLDNTFLNLRFFDLCMQAKFFPTMALDPKGAERAHAVVWDLVQASAAVAEVPGSVGLLTPVAALQFVFALRNLGKDLAGDVQEVRGPRGESWTECSILSHESWPTGPSYHSTDAGKRSGLALAERVMDSTLADTPRLSIMLVGPDGSYLQSERLVEVVNPDPGEYRLVVSGSSGSSQSYDIYVELSSAGKTSFSTTYTDSVQPDHHKAVMLQLSASTSGGLAARMIDPPSEVSVAYVSFDGTHIQGYPTAADVDRTPLMLNAGFPKVLVFSKGVSQTITLDWPEVVMVGTDTRYYLESNTRTFSTSGWINFTVSTQFLVSIQSPYGSPKGSGWYDEGSEAVIYVEPLIEYANGTRKVFAGWRGDVTSNSSEWRFTVDGPKNVEATWKEVSEVNTATLNVAILYETTAVILAIAALAGAYFVLRRRGRRNSTRPPATSSSRVRIFLSSFFLPATG
jgi:hypothetical protein